MAAEKGPLMTKRIHFFVWTRIFKKGNRLEGTICIYENIEMMCHISIYVINGVSVCNIYIYAFYIKFMIHRYKGTMEHDAHLKVDDNAAYSM